MVNHFESHVPQPPPFLPLILLARHLPDSVKSLSVELKESIAQWEFNSRADAFWSVLSAPDKLGGKWEPGEFFRTGDEAIFSLLAHLKHLGLTVNPGRALDFGCGVG